MSQFILYRFADRSATRRRLSAAYAAFVWSLSLMAPGWASAQTAPTQEEIAAGYLPYHHLIVDDFPVLDTDPSPEGMYTYGFRHYNYRGVTVPKDGGFSTRVTEWIVRCGFDRNKSWRKSWFKAFSEILPHEQGHLDISVLHSLQLATISIDKLPTGEGRTATEAAESLKRHLEALVAETSKKAQAEQDAYDAATSHGANLSKQRQWTTTIHERLKEASVSQ